MVRPWRAATRSIASTTSLPVGVEHCLQGGRGISGAGRHGDLIEDDPPQPTVMGLCYDVGVGGGGAVSVDGEGEFTDAPPVVLGAVTRGVPVGPGSNRVEIA